MMVYWLKMGKAVVLLFKELYKRIFRVFDLASSETTLRRIPLFSEPIRSFVLYGLGFSILSWSNQELQRKRKLKPLALPAMYKDKKQPVLFSGEMIFPWMTEDYKEIGGIGCNALAHALANKDDWGSLYDAEHMRAVLGDGRTRSAAAIYYDDLYVDFDHCMKVTSRNGPLEKCKVYITNEYQHSGLRDNGAAIFSKLHGMATGSIRNPS